MKNNRLGRVLLYHGARLLGLSLVVLPFLLLIPLGLLWVWQEGWLLWWLVLAAVVAVASYVPALWWRLRSQRPDAHAGTEGTSAASEPGSDWSPRDLEAWEEVQQIAGETDRHIVTDRDRLLAVARATIERVAHHYHPEDRDPIWSFTLPELLMLTERISIRLRLVVLEHVPAAHLIEAGHLLRAWEYKPLASAGLRAFRQLHNVWRVTRLANPMSALLMEARQRIFGAAMTEAGDYLRSQGARIWVEEVGRAAIELYSGRLRVDMDRLRVLAATEGGGKSVSAAPLPGPLRMLVAGQVNAGKSSLVNCLLGKPAAAVAAAALTTRASGYPLSRDDLPEGLLVDTPGLRSTDDIKRLVERAWESDLLVWVVAAEIRDRSLDRDTLDAIRARFATDTRRSPIPIVVVLSHIDQLAPQETWDSPYRSDAPRDPKAQAIHEALDRLAADLDIPVQSIVPARLEPPEQAYNVDLVWALLAAHYPQAGRCRAQRLHLQATGRDWKKVVRQTLGASRMLTRRIWR